MSDHLYRLAIDMLKEQSRSELSIITPANAARYLQEYDDPLLRIVRENRPYRLPKGYIRWELLSAIVTISIQMKDVQEQDFASYLNANRTALWFVQNAPIYCISTDLLRAFELSNVENQPEMLADMDDPPVPTFILLFPQNAVRTATGEPIDYCVVHMSDLNHREWSVGSDWNIRVQYLEHEHDRNLHWSTIDSKGTVWFSGSGIYPDGRVIHTDDQIGLDVATSEDLAFLAKMRSIVLQCIMTMNYRPDLLDSQPMITVPQPRVKRHQKPKPEVWAPRWLGKDYHLPRQYVSSNNTHASPRPHWRRRHEKRVAVGPGRSDRKWVWIERTWIGEPPSDK